MIINYLITKVDAKREDNIPPETQMGISNNITVLDVEKDEKFKVLKFQFRFDAKFTANSSDELGHIVIEGFIVHTSSIIFPFSSLLSSVATASAISDEKSLPMTSISSKP